MNKEQNTCNNSTNFYKKNSIQKKFEFKKTLKFNTDNMEAFSKE